MAIAHALATRPRAWHEQYPTARNVEKRMKTGIVIFPGINRERDMAIALERSGAKPRMIWHKETDLSGLDLIVIPGGFSFGDYLRCGAMAAHSPVMPAIRAHA